MQDNQNSIKKYALTFGLTPGILWLAGGILGVYLSKGTEMLFISAAITGGLPIITTIISSRYNIAGSLFLIVEALLIFILVYSESRDLIVIAAVFLSYSLPLIISAVIFIYHWYKGKTRI